MHHAHLRARRIPSILIESRALWNWAFPGHYGCDLALGWDYSTLSFSGLRRISSRKSSHTTIFDHFLRSAAALPIFWIFSQARPACSIHLTPPQEAYLGLDNYGKLIISYCANWCIPADEYSDGRGIHDQAPERRSCSRYFKVAFVAEEFWQVGGINLHSGAYHSLLMAVYLFLSQTPRSISSLYSHSCWFKSVEAWSCKLHQVRLLRSFVSLFKSVLFLLWLSSLPVVQFQNRRYQPRQTLKSFLARSSSMDPQNSTLRKDRPFRHIRSKSNRMFDSMHWPSYKIG